MESMEHRRTTGAQENIKLKNPDAVGVLGVFVLCGIHLSYSIAHQEQSSASWLKQTAMHFMDVINEGAGYFRKRIVGRPFVEIPAGLAPAHLRYTRVLVIVRLVPVL
jgi:hypothetical protein